MSGPVVLDAEASSSLAGRATPHEREVRAAMRAADRLGRDVVVPTVILAQLYRGSRYSQFVDSCLSRETGVRTRDTDRRLARLIGGVLAVRVPDQIISLMHTWSPSRWKWVVG